MIFVFFDLLCSFFLFLPDLVDKMSSNREQKRIKLKIKNKTKILFNINYSNQKKK